MKPFYDFYAPHFVAATSWTFDNFVDIKAICGNFYSTEYFYTKYLSELTCLENELIVE